MTDETTCARCPHELMRTVVCPECDAGAYEAALPQAERVAGKRKAAIEGSEG